MVKAIVLLSGGLDSKLVVKLLQEQNIELTGLHFNLPFGSGCCKQMCSWKFMQIEGIPLHIIDCAKGKEFKEYLEIIKKPKFGYGSGMNPCIDCRIFMLKKARKLMKKEKADFIATGEVLNERPMSQHFKAMQIAENESGLKGKLLRPLSAKLLEETDAEKRGLVDRNKLLDIRGRRRIRQIGLANKYKITYPSPGGGCLLCEKEYAGKLKDLFEHKETKEEDIKLLKLGRHFRFDNEKIIVGKNAEENEELMKFEGIKFELADVPGPTTLLRGNGKEGIEKAAQLTIYHSKYNKPHTKVVYGTRKSKISGAPKIRMIFERLEIVEKPKVF